MESLSTVRDKDERNNQAQLQELAKSAFLKVISPINAESNLNFEKLTAILIQ